MIGSGNPNPVPVPASARFQPGRSGNPGGTAVGARKRLTGAFLNDLAADYALHGKDAIETLRVTNPKAYIGAVVRLCPRELEVSNALDGLDNDALRMFMAMAQQYSQVRRERLTQAEAVITQLSERTEATDGCE